MLAEEDAMRGNDLPVPFESELRRVRMPLFITVNMNLSLNFYPGKLPKRVPLRSRLWLWLRPQGVPERWMNIKCLLVPAHSKSASISTT